MSKLFDALKRTAESNKDILAIVEPATQAEESVVEPATQAGESFVEPAPPPPVAAPPEPEEPPAAPAAAPPQPAPGYRMEHLHISVATPTLPFDGSHSRAAEQYRLIRTRLRNHASEPRLIVVSSPAPRDGKTVTAINLAAAMALKGGESVLLVDGDLRRPGIAALLGISGEPGLSAVLEGSTRIEQAVVTIAELPGLNVLPAGKASVNPTELFDSELWRDVREWMRLHFDHVVVDSPPISSVADYELLERSADGVIIVIRPDHTNRNLAFKVLESVPREKQLGVVVNCAVEWFLHRPEQSYYYGAH